MDQDPTPAPPLADLQAALPSPWARGLYSMARPLVNGVLKLDELNATYARAYANPEPLNGFDRVLQEMGVRIDIRDEDLARIPEKGPVLVVSNHPFGAIDGVAMGSVLLRRRPDARLLVNYLLERVEFLRPWLYLVDPFGGEAATQRNITGMKQCLRHLGEGGLIATWPAGTVSHWHWSQRQVTDPQWAQNLAGIIRRTKATVVPAFFPGQNSLLFQLAGLVHPRARTAMLARELIRQQGRSIEIRFGQAITANRLARFTDDRELMDFLRLKCYVLKDRELAEKVSFRRARPEKPTPVAEVPAGHSHEALAAEVAGLPAEACLVRQGDWGVYFAEHAQLPKIMDEIGRLRELTFRAVGEGTNGARDLDRFDKHYHHMFLWHHGANELVGAYRLGMTDQILPKHGTAGIYTTTLFRYQPGVLEGFGSAIEMGRSFVRPEYQRKPQSLSLLWRGIGTLASRKPQYRYLFGPVSISKEYKSVSKNLMMLYLKEHSFNWDLAAKIQARNPPKTPCVGGVDRTAFAKLVRDIDDVSALVHELEHEERGVPVLLRQYLKLNATVMSFNVDPDFNDCLDGLILVDLTKCSSRVLTPYFGEEGLKRFFDYHGIKGE